MTAFSSNFYEVGQRVECGVLFGNLFLHSLLEFSRTIDILTTRYGGDDDDDDDARMLSGIRLNFLITGHL